MEQYQHIPFLMFVNSNPHSAPLTVTNGDYGGKLMKNE
jgi:hypothetical protein